MVRVCGPPGWGLLRDEIGDGEREGGRWRGCGGRLELSAGGRGEAAGGISTELSSLPGMLMETWPLPALGLALGLKTKMCSECCWTPASVTLVASSGGGCLLSKSLGPFGAKCCPQQGGVQLKLRVFWSEGAVSLKPLLLVCLGEPTQRELPARPPELPLLSTPPWQLLALGLGFSPERWFAAFTRGLGGCAPLLPTAR